jgi:transposase
VHVRRGGYRRRGLRGLRRRGGGFGAEPPSLLEGQVVLLEGLGAHRTKRVRELLEGRGCDLVFVPSYWPEMNPIEEAFSKIKNLLRKAGEREREALNEAIALRP